MVHWDSYVVYDVIFIVLFCVQIVVCKNNSRSRDVCCSVLSHELIHMFDFCRAKADFTNLQHLACTEASLTVLFANNYSFRGVPEAFFVFRNGR